ncbi:MAG: hypothetical protein JWO82_42, partial [Akkermansiaceae bacterium]|nr:hypothetical protein [Akkermansiaceae bacterium]
MMALVQAPDVQGLEVLLPLGAGECGKVFLAREAGGREVVVKTFLPNAINRQLLERATFRLEEAGWPAGAMPEWSADFQGRTPLRIGPGYFDGEGDTRVPASLQHRLANFPGDQSWTVVLGILRALAGLHACQVSHGNLKPGNVFFGPGGEALLSDWALGTMPGVQGLLFTDALLYQSPEQLRDPGGYLQEKGYRWDVFAFGVLAYRLLVGTFPRCGPTFEQVAPAPGLTRREGIAADLSLIAASIEAQPQVSWPDQAANPLEEAYREILLRCLSLDPRHRPANAGEVGALFAAAEETVKNERRTAVALDQGRRAQRRSWRASMASWMMTAGVVVICFLWQFNRSQNWTSVERSGEKLRSLEDEVREARAKRETAEKSALNANQELSRDRDLWLTRIESSREIGDRLFAWAMEKGNRRLPPLDGRESRLNRLDRYFVDFVTRNAEIPELKKERAVAKLQLAEIALAKGDPDLAETRLEDAVKGSPDLPGGADLDLRLATDRMLLALLLQERVDPTARDAFKIARDALEHVPQTEVDADRVQELLAVLDFHESRLLAAAGQDAEALEKLHRSTEVLNRLVLERPDAMVLRSEMAMCYLSSATILDGIG